MAHHARLTGGLGGNLTGLLLAGYTPATVTQPTNAVLLAGFGPGGSISGIIAAGLWQADVAPPALARLVPLRITVRDPLALRITAI